MKIEEFDAIYKDVPFMVRANVTMSQPNDPVVFYDGPFVLKTSKNTINLEGKIQFAWLPFPMVEFRANIIGQQNIDQMLDITIEADGNSWKGQIRRWDPNTKILVGIVKDSFRKGDVTRSADKIVFEVPNMRQLLGEKVRHGNTGMCMHRSRFEVGDYLINMDMHLDWAKKERSAQMVRGYRLMFTGELLKSNSTLSFWESHEVLEGFSLFLSFVNGRITSPLFRTGFLKGAVAWNDYSVYPTAFLQPVLSWSNVNFIHLNDLWKNFSQFWELPTDRQCIDLIIHWYNQANSGAIYVEGSIILAQNALELLYSWIQEIRQPTVHLGTASSKASDKIISMLRYCSAPISYPAALLSYDSVSLEYQASGPFLLTTVRNSFAHSDPRRNLEKQYEFDAQCRYDVLMLALWYIEIILLHCLRYHGKYFNRCAQFGKNEENVPWTKPALD